MGETGAREMGAGGRVRSRLFEALPVGLGSEEAWEVVVVKAVVRAAAAEMQTVAAVMAEVARTEES